MIEGADPAISNLIDYFSSCLRDADVHHVCYHDCIHIDLPGHFGTLELKVWPDGDAAIQLLKGDFHTHASLLAREYDVDPAQAFTRLVGRILRGELLLVEESASDGSVRRTIESSLQDFLRYLPTGATYRIANPS